MDALTNDLEGEYVHVCSSCLEPIEAPAQCYDMNLVKIRLVEGRVRHMLVQRDESEAFLEPEEGEQGPADEALLETLYFHDEHWDDVAGAVSSLVEDHPPVSDVVDIVVCDVCSDTIRIGEKSALLRQGVLTASKKKDGSTTFKPRQHYDLCLLCAMRVSDLIECEYWADLSQNYECYDCTRSKCWREGRCGCACHKEDE